MSSDLQSTLLSLEVSAYVSAVVLTGVMYDYLLTLSREVTYIWERPWTWVSTMFVVIRYAGLLWVLVGNLCNLIFVPGIAKWCVAIYVILDWTLPIYFAAADLVMILRVYAMWNRSKWILYTFLFIYVLQVITSLVFTGVFDNPNTSMLVTAQQALNLTFCNLSFVNPSLIVTTHLYFEILRFTLSAALLILAVIQTLRQSINMYKATQQWQPNRYMQQFVADGFLYFLVYISYSIYVILQNLQTTNTYVPSMLYMLSCVLIFPMMPRFIITMREMYDRESLGVDTAFGASSQRAAGTETLMSVIAFANPNPGKEEGQRVDDDAGDSGVIQLREVGDGAHRV